jgi:hypothetical protein
MEGIEIYWKPVEPVDVDQIRAEVDMSRDFPEHYEPGDVGKLVDNWDKLHEHQRKHGQPESFSTDRYLASLVSVSGGVAHFVPTGGFWTYNGVSRNTADDSFANPDLYDMRVSSVGALVESTDGTFPVHRRPDDASHVPGVYDCSAAGLAPIKEGRIDFVSAIMTKLKRELELKDADIRSITTTSLHSVGRVDVSGGDYSGMFTFHVLTKWGNDELAKRASEGFGDDYQMVDRPELLNFVLNNYRTGPACLDGAVTLAAGMPDDHFQGIMGELGRHRRIAYGKLHNRVFQETSLNDVREL